MRLFKFRIKNYRSFIDTGDIKLSKDQNLIPIIGENNIGKTNLVSAICLGLTAIKSTYHYSILDKQRVKKLDRRSFPYARVKYLFERDYPVTLQKRGTEPTLIELWFETNGTEKKKFEDEFGFYTKAKFKVKITFENDRGFVEIFVRGIDQENENNQRKLRCFLADHIDVYHIEAVRIYDNIEKEISKLIAKELEQLGERELSKYQELNDEILAIEEPVFTKVSESIRKDFEDFIPNLSSIRISPKNNYLNSFNRHYSRKDFDFILDDGTETDLNSKGDGIISLAEIALIKHNAEIGAENNLILAIEEPEAHLHTGSIYKLKDTLNEIAKKYQVIYSTHSSILANQVVESNLIVERKVSPINENLVRHPKDRRDIGNALGMRKEETLYYLPDLIILVEGKNDQKCLEKILPLFSQEVNSAIEKNRIAIRAVNSSSKFGEHIRLISISFTTDFYCLFDHDDAGKRELKELIDKKLLDEKSYSEIRVKNKKSSEFEDWIEENILNEAISEICGTTYLSEYKDTPHNFAFSDRLQQVFQKKGEYEKEEIKEKIGNVKKDIVERIESSRDNDWKLFIRPEAQDDFIDFVDRVKSKLKKSIT